MTTKIFTAAEIERAAEVLYGWSSSMFMPVWKVKDGVSDGRLDPIAHIEHVLRALNAR